MKASARPILAALRRGYSAQAATQAHVAASDSAPRISRLPNGAVVVTVENHSPVSRVAVLYNAGSRYEDRENEGITHCIRNAVNLSNKKSTGFGLTRSIEQVGGSLDCTTTREHMIYGLTCIRDAVEESLVQLGHATMHPAFKPWDLSDAVGRLKLDNSHLKTQPDAQLMDAVHQAAYRDGLGRSIYMPDHRIGSHSTDMCLRFTDKLFVPANMAIVGCGVDHEAFLYHLQHKFGFGRGGEGGLAAQPAKAQYFGGEVRISTNSPFVHSAVVTEGVSLGSKEMPALAVLQKILGTGPYVKYSNNSSSPLMKAAAQIVADPFAVNAININYSDTGLFGFYAVTHAKDTAKVLRAVLTQMASFTKGGLTDKEVARGKAQLKSALLFSNECQESFVDDIGTQAILTGQVLGSESLLQAIDAVTLNDVATVAKKVINGKPTMATVGNLVDTPYLDQLL